MSDGSGNFPPMAQEPERKKHRHDLGQEDHGAKLAEGTTKAIQTLLGLWIILTLGFVVYALVDASQNDATASPRESAAPPDIGTEAPAPSLASVEVSR